MGIRTFLFILIAAFLMLGCAGSIRAEDVVRGGAVPESEREGSMQWVWGEVVNLDAQNKTLTVKYLDYETDQEKEMGVAVDDETTYENIKSLNEVNLKDVVSIDFIVDAAGENIARNISVEKAEGAEVEESSDPDLEEEMPDREE
jgi:hypothetical protein